MLQRGLEIFLKWLRQGLNPQLSWLTTVCLRGVNRNAPQVFPVFPVHHVFFSTIVMTHVMLTDVWSYKFNEPYLKLRHKQKNCWAVVA